MITQDTIILVIPALVGLAFIVTGLIMLRFPPKKINYFYGYRTPSSMKNQKNWDFAQTYSAKEFTKAGVILVLINSLLYAIKPELMYIPLTTVILIIGSVAYAVIRTEIAIKQLAP